MHFPFPILVADIGGTHVRFALAEAPGRPLTQLPRQATAAHPGLESAARAALTGVVIQPRSMLACAAGPVQGRSVRLTNAAWSIDGPDAAHALGLEQGILFNDFEAQALSIPVLKPEWLRGIGGIPFAAGPRLIHGPGTGLGTAALVDAGGRWLAVVSEASHSDFAPVTAQETAFWPFVERVQGRLTPETLISGPGLARLHSALALSRGDPAEAGNSAAIIARACADAGSSEAESVRAFWRLAARFAGDMALAFVATGGVVLAGGILPRILALLDEREFRAAFENKAPYAPLMRTIPAAVLVQNDSVLSGLAEIAGAPDRYAIDYKARLWR